MKNNNTRKELGIGLCLMALFMLLKQFTATPHFILGMLVGFGILFELIGTLPETAYMKLKEFKKGLFCHN